MRRRLSPYERVIWAAGEVLPANVACISRIHGRVSPDRLRKALVAARRRHPLLAVRLADPGQWQAWVTTHDVPDPELRVVKATAPSTWTRVIEEELQRRFDTSAGPLSRFVLVDAGDSFDLIGVYHHLVADAHSAVIIVRDILRWLADPTAIDSAPVLAPPADDLLPGRRANVADLLKVGRMLHGTARPARAARPTDRLTFATWSFSAEETFAFLTRCRAERTTPQSVLSTAFARAFPHCAHIAMAVDLRRILIPCPKDAFGLYAASFVMPVDGTVRRGFWGHAREVKADIYSRLHLDELRPLVRVFRLFSFLPRKAIGSLLHHSEAKSVHFDVSISIARASIPRDYGPLRLLGVYGAAHTSLPGVPLVIVVGFDGRLFFSVTSTDAAGSAKLCERAMAHLVDVLSRDSSS